MSVTIKDIARKLNISISTVSYALNNGPRPVPPEVRARVLATAQEMNYRPNTLARSMATGRTDTLAVVPPAGGHPMLLSPYLLTVLNGIMEAAEELQQDILLHSVRTADPLHPDLENQELARLTRSLLGGKVDGVLLIVPHTDSPLPAQIAEHKLPCVVFSSDGPPGTVTVCTDNAHATRQAMEHLYALGHRHIAHVAGKAGLRDAEQRRAAYLEFLHEKGLPAPTGWLVGGDFTYQRSREASRPLLTLPNRPTAVLAGNDESGLGVIDTARELGIRVPEDLSVIAFDLLPPPFQRRALTSVRQPVHQMATEAVRLLTQWAQSGELPAQTRRIYATELVDRGTTAKCSR